MLQTTRSLGVSASLALALAASPVFGAAYQGAAYEGFTDYTAGTTIGATFNGGTGWNATGDANLANTTSWGVGTNLTITGQGATIQSPGLVSNSAVVSGATASSSIGRQFGQTVDSGTFYFSFLTQKINTELRTVNFSFFGTNERLAIGQIASNLNTRDQDGNWLSNAGANSGNFAALISNSQNNSANANTVGVATNGVYVNTTSPVAYSSTTTLIVGKIEFNFAGGASVEDRLTLYVNPGDLLNEGSLVSYLMIDHNDFGSLTGFRIFAGTTASPINASGAQFDQIRLGTNYLSVTGAAIPEPSSYAALLGLAGLGFAASRRRRA